MQRNKQLHIPLDAIKEAKVFSLKYRYNDILLKKNNINFIYPVDRIMDFNRVEPTFYRSYFPYASSGQQMQLFHT